jgi:flagellar basal-body rod protein FlgF
MENTSYVALSRQTALWRQLEVTANNMANANTPAFKGEQVQFEDYVVKTKSPNSPFGQKVSFVHDFGTIRDTREGPMTKTGAPLDVSIHGDGYFTIDTPAGQRYTREGHFRQDENGMVVTASGYPVLQANDNPIVLAPNESQINIAPDGTMSVVTFDDDQQVKKAGDGTYQTNQTPTVVDRPYLSQGMLEDSNVQPIAEMTNMLSILRSYEGVQSIIQLEQDRQTKAMPVLSESHLQA